jgi:hypothetical protein
MSKAPERVLVPEELLWRNPERPAYLHLLARAVRFFERIRHQTAPTAAEFFDSQRAYEDDLWSFFLHCWHVKDWLSCDEGLSEDVREKVCAEVHASLPLQICADLANGAKHFTLDWSRVGATQEGALLTPDTEGEGVSWEYVVLLANGSHVGAHEVARKALRKWREILTRHGLPVLPGLGRT